MPEQSALNIPKALEEIGEAVLASLSYSRYPLEKLERVMAWVDEIIDNPGNRKACEDHLRSAGSNYVLFFLSNIIYNLKQRGQLVLSDDVMRWLGSVWKNFLRRGKSYQEMFPRIDEYRIRFKKYYPYGGNFVSQLENVNLIKEDFATGDTDSENSNIRQLEKFYQSLAEILTAMKPSYFFLLDYYYEKKIATGVDSPEAVTLESGGLAKFGHINYTYGELAVIACQTLGILEASYLILKKKKSQRRLINIDGKQKFLTAPEIYNHYLEKFNAMKKELSSLNK